MDATGGSGRLSRIERINRHGFLRFLWFLWNWWLSQAGSSLSKSPKWRFWHAKIAKMAIWACQKLCFLPRQGAHFQKIMKKVVRKWKMEPKDVRWQVWLLYEGAWWGRKAKMLAFHRFYISPRLSRLCIVTHPRRLFLVDHVKKTKENQGLPWGVVTLS